MILHNTGPAGDVRRRAGHADRPARRRRRPGVGAARGRRAARPSERGEGGFGSSGTPLSGRRAAHPGLGAAALARPHAALPAREAREGVLAAARAGASNSGESLARRAAPRARRGGRRSTTLPFEGPIAIVDSIAPARALRAKHVVHIIFSGDLGGRSLEAVTSADAAVRGHRLFGLDELDEIVLHPPIQRFLARWRPGDPTVYLGPLWAP